MKISYPRTKYTCRIEGRCQDCAGDVLYERWFEGWYWVTQFSCACGSLRRQHSG